MEKITALTPEEILNKHLRTSDDIWELADLKAAVLEYAAQNNRNYNENLERVIRQRDALQSRIDARDKEIERLKGLLEVQYKCHMNHASPYSSKEKLQNWWQSYCAENHI